MSAANMTKVVKTAGAGVDRRCGVQADDLWALSKAMVSVHAGSGL